MLSQTGRTAAGVRPDDENAAVALSSGDVLVVFEGRLDDVAALRGDLELDPSTSVARIVADAYHRWGDALVGHLRGDYAFVVWDGFRERVLAARDPFGVRPLHYLLRDGQLCIASDSHQFLEAGLADPVPDDQMVVEFLTHDLQTLDRSFFRDVSRLPPGHLLIATASQTTTSDYRSLPSSELSFSSTDECHEAFRERFFTAVRRRLSSESPVVVQLSGGVDSTSIVCAADSLSKAAVPGIAPVFAASATYPGLDCDETPHIDAVEKHIDIPVFRWNGTLANGVEFAEPLMAAPGNRIPWASGTEGYVAIARTHRAKVILDGTGGDQLGMVLGAELDALRRHDWRQAAQYLFPSGFSRRQIGRVLRWLLAETSPHWIRRFYRRARPRPWPDWLAEGASDRIRYDEPVAEGRSFISHGQRLRWRKLTGAATLTTAVEVKQRHASWSGLEMAFPYLDWDLVQFTLAVPAEHWPPPRPNARIHREALRSDLPRETYLRDSKAEFTSAMTNRVRRNFGLISDVLEGSTWAAARFVDQKRVLALLRSFRGLTMPDFGTVFTLWAITSVEAWLRGISGYGRAT